MKALFPTLLPGGLCLLALSLSGCQSDHSSFALGILEHDLVRLSATANLVITDVFVDEGDEVTVGVPLLQLDTTAADAAVNQAQANLDRARSYLEQLLNGAREEDRAAAAAQVESAEAAAVEAEKNYQRVDRLVQARLLGDAELDSATARREAALASLKEAREKQALLQNGTRREEVEQAQAQVQEAGQALLIAQTSRGDLCVTATRDGRVDSLPWKLGERVPMGAVVAVIVARGNPHVRAYVPETARSRLAVGQSLSVSVDGVSERMNGVLTHIQRAPAFTPHYALTESERSRLMYLAEVQLDDDAAELPDGLPAQVYLPETEGRSDD